MLPLRGGLRTATLLCFASVTAKPLKSYAPNCAKLSESQPAGWAAARQKSG